MPEKWNPKVEEREHPWGEAGVRSSLDEVAKTISKGITDPRVRTWAVKKLDEARQKGASVKRPRERAQVLLAAVQKKLWVPDPIGAEYIPAAHLLACDADEPGRVCVPADDCDGLSSLLGACLGSVGIYVLVVGHAYNAQKNIEHVLCAAHIDNKWHYADPSTDLPLGRCVPFSRERLLSVPNIKTLCDDTACLSKGSYDPDRLEFVDKGAFVGVGGLPSLQGLRSRVVWETTPTENILEHMARRMR